MKNDGRSLERAVAEVLFYLHLPYMRVSNYRCFKCGAIMNSAAKGAADFIVMAPGKLIALEAKSGSGRQTPEQKQWEATWTAAGGEYFVVHNAEEARSAVS